jgi:hypothetical protein
MVVKSEISASFSSLLLIIIVMNGLPLSSAEAASNLLEDWSDIFEYRWGGLFSLLGSASFPESDSYFTPLGLEPLFDGSAEFRFKNTLYLEQKAQLEAHYETVAVGGDTRRKSKELEQIAPNLEGLLDGSIEDDRRFMDLTSVIHDDIGTRWYHRLDRLSLTVLPNSCSCIRGIPHSVKRILITS